MPTTSDISTNSYNFPKKLWERLIPLYGEREAVAITYYVLDVRFNLSKTDVICGKIDSLTDEDKAELESIFTRLEKAEPVQYVIGKAYFCQRQFKVCKGVLIPRPETEELCGIIQERCKEKQCPKILDIGTGSGCIAVTLSLDIAGSKVHAWDISQDALNIAKENATRHNANVTFRQCDILNIEPSSESWDIIVSNPPYICDKEKETMNSNVLDYEPHTALFVPDENPLLFYRAITKYASHTLESEGMLFFEINPLYADETAELLRQYYFEDINIKEDMFGKKRFIYASKKKK